ncbi:hypothetical protein PV08_05088 [Exophiala spinifera]|uniref:Anaphase-promoting complex subunit 11 n=1 Tax=Exophiala spinifera TaxID=91928 RepID=A0A0D2BFW6_9EURO|nr:uncharacterized protein PV08_05088 [Exophiala spinifera]KIW17893.1 hypothetical protein PV08_05088 [Exophiala spinifera]
MSEPPSSMSRSRSTTSLYESSGYGDESEGSSSVDESFSLENTSFVEPFVEKALSIYSKGSSSMTYTRTERQCILLLALVALHVVGGRNRRARSAMATPSRVAPRGAVTKPTTRTQNKLSISNPAAAARLLQKQQEQEKQEEEEQQQYEEERARQLQAQSREQSQYARDRTRRWVESLARHGPESQATLHHSKPDSSQPAAAAAAAAAATTLRRSPRANNSRKQEQEPQQETGVKRMQQESRVKKPQQETHVKQPQDTEKRLKRFRSKPPMSFQIKLERAKSQRMIVLGRKRIVKDDAPCELLEIVGSTGNVYEVVIGRMPSCNCPDALKGNECKHKVYAMHTVLKAPEHLQYQMALLISELEEIFASAPPIPSEVAASDLEKDSQQPGNNRKSTDGECPICYMDLDPKNNKLVWCKAQCGHNLHQSCFDQWVASMAGREVRCVYCRATWEVDVGDAEAIKKAGRHGEDGYINVAEQVGMSGHRDYSSYHRPWVRRQFGGW